MDDLTISPCPCCGAAAKYIEIPVAQNEAECDPNAGGRFIECTKCQLSTFIMFPIMDDVRAQLIQKWNRRTSGEDALHIAICQAVALLNSGEPPHEANAILRASLEDYANGAHLPAQQPADAAGER